MIFLVFKYLLKLLLAGVFLFLIICFFVTMAVFLHKSSQASLRLFTAILTIFIYVQKSARADLSLDCELFCDRQLISDEDDFDLICNKTCKLQECKIGCAKWFTYSNLLNCDQICERKKSGQPIESIYCNIGCNQALWLYTNKSRAEIGSPSAPFLIGDSLRNDSAALQWKTSTHHNVSYLLQFRYSQLSNDWIFYQPERPLRTGQVLVRNLQPYTAYRFRVLWLLEDVSNGPLSERYATGLSSDSSSYVPSLEVEQFQPIYSEESVEIRTLPYGAPSVPPRLISCFPLSSNRLLINYEPPRFPNDRLIGYTLTATPVDQNPNAVDPAEQLLRDLKSNGDTSLIAQSYTLTGVQPNRIYQLSLNAINRFGTGPAAFLNCSTPTALTVAELSLKQSKVDSRLSQNKNEPQIVFATPKLVLLKRSSALMEPVDTLLRLEDFTPNENFTAMALHVQRGYVFVADTAGVIRRLQLSNGAARKILQLSQLLTGWRTHSAHNSLQLRIIAMSVDWLNDRLYLIRQLRLINPESVYSVPNNPLHSTAQMHSYGQYGEQIEMLRCNLDGSDLRTVMRFDYGEMPIQLQLDPFNGFLFWSAVNNYHHFAHFEHTEFGTQPLESLENDFTETFKESESSAPTAISSIYRLDLAMINANHTLSSGIAQIVVRAHTPYAPAFTLSLAEMRLLYVQKISRYTATIRSSSLDGTDPIDSRSGLVESSLFRPEMRNLALFDRMFYWTLGNETIREHFHSGRYFHNTIFVEHRLQRLLSVQLAHPSVQPHPRPLSSVQSLQALFLRTDAKIRWTPPPSLPGTGQGVFSRWNYELCIGELGPGFIPIVSTLQESHSDFLADKFESTQWPAEEASLLRKRICVELTDTFCALGQLKSNTSYVFRVRALSLAGTGPWSYGFYGTTLPEYTLISAQGQQLSSVNVSLPQPQLLLATEIGLLRMNMMGEGVETILSISQIKRQQIRHIASLQQQVFVSLQNGSVLQLPLTSTGTPVQQIGRIAGASCIALDWLGSKLYFGNEPQQTISRSNLDGSSIETLPLFSSVKELVLDSLQAFMYWSTGHSIEVATFHALQKHKYFQVPFFSGNIIQGLAIDQQQRRLFFLVKTMENSRLYSGSLYQLNQPLTNEVFYRSESILSPRFSPIGPYSSFGGKLLWISNEGHAQMSDQLGSNVAQLSFAQRVQSALIVDWYEKAALSFIGGQPNVIPDSIDKSSIKIDGQAGNFTISWQPVHNINYGHVQYELMLETRERLFELHLNESRYQYPPISVTNDLPLPVFKIAIRAYTAWAYSRRTVIFLKFGTGNDANNGKLLYYEPPRRPSLLKLAKTNVGQYELSWTSGTVGYLSHLHGAEHSSDHQNPSLIDSSDGSLVYCVFRKPVAGDRWMLVYNGTNSKTRIQFTSSELKQSHLIKLIAFNRYGESEPLHYNLNPSLDELIDSQHSFDRNLLLVLVGVLATLGIGAVIFYYWCKIVCQQTNEKNKLELVAQHLSGYAPTELATLSNYPIGPAASGGSNHNQLYLSSTVCNSDAELVSLNQIPQVQRKQLDIMGPLGSGAFGNVHEGLVHHLNGQIEKVAIKLARDNLQRDEFIKEAQLMANFQHPHILRLVGICLNNDPMCLLFELMNGGDLAKYLRANRPIGAVPSPLNLAQLIEMCLHVADGCVYLEQMHFVHRDIAARNCLVNTQSVIDNSTGKLRVIQRDVKIGDFGLTRDIYKSDYYRKEGEGLLPVRWMPPESLVDGLFTTQSDVWSFGVLLWEVFTLGESPYQAMSNMEVLNYVKTDGRLNRPDICPSELFDLMIQCWSRNPEERPSFAYCLQALKSIRQQFLYTNTNVSSVHNQNYISNGTNESHGVVKSLATTGSSFGKKADLIDVRSLQLLNPENMALPMEESKDPVIQIQCPDGYEKPITISAF